MLSLFVCFWLFKTSAAPLEGSPWARVSACCSSPPVPSWRGRSGVGWSPSPARTISHNTLRHRCCLRRTAEGEGEVFKTPQSALGASFDVVHHLFHPEESHAGEQRVGPRLMLPSDPLQLQLVRHFLQASLQPHSHRCENRPSSPPPAPPPPLWPLHLQVLAALHQILDVVDGWKEQVEDLEELVLLLG